MEPKELLPQQHPKPKPTLCTQRPILTGGLPSQHQKSYLLSPLTPQPWTLLKWKLVLLHIPCWHSGCTSSRDKVAQQLSMDTQLLLRLTLQGQHVFPSHQSILSLRITTTLFPRTRWVARVRRTQTTKVSRQTLPLFNISSVSSSTPFRA
jgi:hypothetical protein